MKIKSLLIMFVIALMLVQGTTLAAGKGCGIDHRIRDKSSLVPLLHFLRAAEGCSQLREKITTVMNAGENSFVMHVPEDVEQSWHAQVWSAKVSTFRHSRNMSNEENMSNKEAYRAISRYHRTFKEALDFYDPHWGSAGSIGLFLSPAAEGKGLLEFSVPIPSPSRPKYYIIFRIEFTQFPPI